MHSLVVLGIVSVVGALLGINFLGLRRTHAAFSILPVVTSGVCWYLRHDWSVIGWLYFTLVTSLVLMMTGIALVAYQIRQQRPWRTTVLFTVVAVLPSLVLVLTAAW